jgi:hypothetical protein
MVVYLQFCAYLPEERKKVAKQMAHSEFTQARDYDQSLGMEEAGRTSNLMWKTMTGAEITMDDLKEELACKYSLFSALVVCVILSQISNMITG